MVIFTLLYNEYKVIDASLTQLRKTNVLNLPIIAVDNAYPNLSKSQVTRLKNKHGLRIVGKRVNRGLSGGYNDLINAHPDIRYAILFDCDSWPVTHGWDKALMDVIQSPKVAYLSLMFDVAKREMKERGFTPWLHESGHVIWKPNQACVQSISCADLDYLRKIGGLKEPKKYYGGLEGEMFSQWNYAHQIGYIDGVYETQHPEHLSVDPKYKAYKWAYAHEGYAGSFDEFLISNK
jgi:GT2 family glycosyltransferase